MDAFKNDADSFQKLVRGLTRGDVNNAVPNPTIDVMLDKNVRDSLTGLYNQGFFHKKVEELTTEKESPIGLIILDIDNFKEKNNIHGHPAVNMLLKSFANLLGRVRPGDIVARYGGDEFAILLPNNSNINDIETIAERIRLEIKEAEFRISNKPNIKITVSLGFGVWNCTESAEELLERVDKALYDAKAAGKNRIAMAKST